MQLEHVEEFALEQMTKWGLIQKGWTFAFNKRYKRTLGSCNDRDKEIEVGEQYARMNGQELVHNTILHEIAHALAGCHNGHNDVWKLWCMRVGARPERCVKAGVVVRQVKKYRLYIIGVDGKMEKTDHTSDRKTSLVGRWLKGKPETKNNLVWLSNS